MSKRQLRRAVMDSLQAALDSEIRDPLLEDVYLFDVVEEPSGRFTALFATNHNVSVARDAVVRAQPIFRLVLARRLARKRVPSIDFEVIPGGNTDE